MSDTDAYQQLLGDAFRYLSVRGRSHAEMQTYLAKRAVKRDIPPEAVLQALNRLEQLGYIDDYKFAQQWIASRTRTKIKGPTVIRQELKFKGVDPEIIDQACTEASLLETSTQKELAEQAIQKKLQLWQKLPPLACKQKTYSFIIRRGFSAAIARSLVDEYCTKAYNKARK